MFKAENVKNFLIYKLAFILQYLLHIIDFSNCHKNMIIKKNRQISLKIQIVRPYL